jgi:hypothetical protein
MTSDLPARISAALDRIEDTARAATPGPWSYDERAVIFGPHNSSIFQCADCEAWGEADEEDAAHIALNDPAFVLAWCAGIRAVVEVHAPVDAGHDFAYCLVCVQHDYTDTMWPCPTLTALAGAVGVEEGP